ncbi:thioredoxin-like protein [Protomyces lactucae-debilis]|uniref:Thioredoxin-like protein n=1 Tax=Protomyces lactucae-debilis TaxID=2754530 RepID=A0A1Y2EX71_PROLT|nr:thioredoxin-like protein [Protomyces lactucae-debilis]ORY75726.1 thioredoxin-like protein [Protomyces lactucae-debilis]
MASKYAFSGTLKEVRRHSQPSSLTIQLRFHFCQTSEASTGLKQFLQKAYPVMKKHNPSTPLLVREAFGTPPKIWARYEKGREVSVSVDGLSTAEVEKQVQSLAQASS